ncbi:MAG TPA: response regulator [Nitrososphaera sp.]|nr:response regulator [Nitrososphaera sp.]
MLKDGESQAKNARIVARESKKWRVMVVDDEHDITSIFKAGLEGNGFQVDVYNDPEKALQKFKPGAYDILLLDVRMPGMSGFELYHELRKRDENVKVCFLTAFEMYRKEFSSTFPYLDEVKCFLKKPILMKDLLKRLAAILEPG